MADLKILQVVGFKNSGKTTLIADWTELLSQQGKNVAVIKHHGHGGALQMPDQNADSMVMLEAGATSSLAYGDGCIQLHIQRQEAKLSKLIELVQWSQPDVVLIEGFKGADYPKVVLLREENDWEELSKLTGIECVIAQTQIELSNYSLINRQDVKATRQWLLKWMDGDRNENV